MAIVIMLDDLLHDRRMTLTDLGDRIGLTLANLSILKTGKARAIRFSTLEAICEALSCQPGDLLRFKPDGPVRQPELLPQDSTDESELHLNPAAEAG
jgi:putative transcriptional regulator